MPVTVCSKRAEPILICKKCLKRLPDGKAVKQKLKSEVRKNLVAGSRKKPRLILTGCLGICPKHAVVVTNGAFLSRGEYLMTDDRSIGSVATALMRRGDFDESARSQ